MCFNISIYMLNNCILAFIFFESDELHFKRRIQTHLYLLSSFIESEFVYRKNNEFRF